MNRENICCLFRFIQDLSESNKTITDLNDQRWYKFLRDIDENTPGVKKYSAGNNNENLLLQVERIDLPVCPEPPKMLKRWLFGSYDKIDWRQSFVEFMPDHSDLSILSDIDRGENDSAKHKEERFSDDPKRVEMFDKWMDLRNQWVKDYQEKLKTLNLFEELCEKRDFLERDISQEYEIVAGNALFETRRSQKRDGQAKLLFGNEKKVQESKIVFHPLAERRVRLEFEFEKTPPKISLYMDESSQAKIFTDPLAVFSDTDKPFNLSFSQEAENLLNEHNIHLFDEDGIAELFNEFAVKLDASHVRWFGSNEKPVYNEKIDSSITYAPVLFIKKRPRGVKEAIEKIIHAINAGTAIPSHLEALVNGRNHSSGDSWHPVSIEERLIQECGEDEDILFTKPANKEQLNIARILEKQESVIVQGPPGTGKTHTIANLLGHFLAQGKRVLVTSHTTKALEVLKEKLPKELQALCVSMIGSDIQKSLNATVNELIGRLGTIQVHEMQKRELSLQRERSELIADIRRVRHEMFAIRRQEIDSIAYEGDGSAYSLCNLGKWLKENEFLDDVIPGRVAESAVFPFADDELQFLYGSNKYTKEKQELDFSLPSVDELPDKDEVDRIRNELEQVKNDILARGELGISIIIGDEYILFNIKEEDISLTCKISELSRLSGITFPELIFKKSDFYRNLVIDGMQQDFKAGQWNRLFDLVHQVADKKRDYQRLCYQDTCISSRVEIESNDYLEDIKKAAEFFIQKCPNGNLGFLGRILHRRENDLIDLCQIDGKRPDSLDDFKLLIRHIELVCEKNTLHRAWDEMVLAASGKPFDDFGPSDPELDIEALELPDMRKAVAWWSSDFQEFKEDLTRYGLHIDALINSFQHTGSANACKLYLSKCEEFVFPLVKYVVAWSKKAIYEKRFDEWKKCVAPAKADGSEIAKKIWEYIDSGNGDYQTARNELIALDKIRPAFQQRQAFLQKLECVAPEWAHAIRRHEGIHGEEKLPSNLREAWKWHQLNALFNKLIQVDYAALQKKCNLLTDILIEKTTELVDVRAWSKLKESLEHRPTLMSDLRAWQSLYKRIGKGTGKNASRYRNQAREKMKSCQDAVPIWVMTTQEALLNFNVNSKFDIVIVDEASQSGLSALPVTFMAEKSIIVGDDRQVTPTIIGSKSEEVDSLVQRYIKNRVRNWEVYREDSSLYEIAGMIYSSYMLREHFRCVPDIINFCNRLAYDGKIRPIRDAASSRLFPALVPYRVRGFQEDNENSEEALAIVALLKACLEMPEYDGKSFGVISMLSDKGLKGQSNRIRRLIQQHIDPSDIERRDIRCGNASQFQGDERDVIFLSLVAGTEDFAPLTLITSGRGDDAIKRYNVAVSRARDQLWVVHSFDPNSQLKPDDIRKKLFDHIQNPKASKEALDEAERKAESPFEAEVAKALLERGYHVEQQRQIGSYRVDMVIHCGERQIILECDGERYHSGEEQIVNDMSRQIILERSGWRFVRLRGSEYYRNKEKAIEHVCQQLKEIDIYPESVESIIQPKQTDLQIRVMNRAAIILEEIREGNRPLQLGNNGINKKELLLEDISASEVESMNVIGVKGKRGNVGNRGNIISTPYSDQLVSNEGDGDKVNKSYERIRKIVYPKGEDTERERRIAKEDNELLVMFKRKNLSYVDKRAKNGFLWVIGPESLKPMFQDIWKRYKLYFMFTKNGSKATGYKPGWWLATRKR